MEDMEGEGIFKELQIHICLFSQKSLPKFRRFIYRDFVKSLHVLELDVIINNIPLTLDNDIPNSSECTSRSIKFK